MTLFGIQFPAWPMQLLATLGLLAVAWAGWVLYWTARGWRLKMIWDDGIPGRRKSKG